MSNTPIILKKRWCDRQPGERMNPESGLAERMIMNGIARPDDSAKRTGPETGTAEPATEKATRPRPPKRPRGRGKGGKRG